MGRRRNADADERALQNAASTLLANIRFGGVDKPIKSIVVTSSVANEGKTTVTYHLARAIASSGKRVLVVECDMRNRSVAHVLGTTARFGIYAVLSGKVELEQAVVQTEWSNLYFLDSEPQIPNPSDILSSMRFRSLMSVMEQKFDYVLLDTPPVGAFVDAAVIAELADTTVMVVRENFVKRDELVAAYDQLMKAGAHVAGVVMNMCDMETNSYYSYYGKDSKRKSSDGRVNEGPSLPKDQSVDMNMVGSQAAAVQPRQQVRKADPGATLEYTSLVTNSSAAAGVKPVVQPVGRHSGTVGQRTAPGRSV
ncbi:CpsD/CapB family tyrosine-protein kinase [Collinsella tanakaei]|uniref:CpsD/CapB family tyrosine-protein kinase n=1 Tax=Collinsella tanakaei TaxID=626935 RepID=UPI00195A8EFE|nr:CpsD/CapB family tyrosine-protein kinase [Collinsella tanakaei]MBM6756768.1 CpsD/CapB family tyrosine-protein kinase [Collinsella tanakaei]